jgi:hypothetical protein
MPRSTLWLACRRPLFVAFIIGCAVSLLTSGRLTLRLVLPATLYWTFVPLAEIAGLVFVWRARPPGASLPHAIDRYFRNSLLWLLWLTVFAAAWAFLPPAALFAWRTSKLVWYGSALTVAACSAYLDYRYFSGRGGRWSHPLRALLLQRLIAWSLGLAWFMAPSIWSTVGP